MKYIHFAIIPFLCLASTNPLFASSIEKLGENDFCKIAKVDDGDTFDLQCNEKYYPNVRLLGVNTPDIHQNSRKKSCYYDEAKEILEKKKSRLYKVEFYGSDLCKDPYKGCRNLVRLIDIEKDFDLGERMIRRGFAFSWTNFSMIPSHIAKSYELSESAAVNNNFGLWRDCRVEYFDDTRMDSSIPDKMTI